MLSSMINLQYVISKNFERVSFQAIAVSLILITIQLHRLFSYLAIKHVIFIYVEIVPCIVRPLVGPATPWPVTSYDVLLIALRADVHFVVSS